MWVFFHEHSRFTGQKSKREVISLTPLYYLHPLQRHLDISQMITSEDTPLHKSEQKPWKILAKKRTFGKVAGPQSSTLSKK